MNGRIGSKLLVELEKREIRVRTTRNHERPSLHDHHRSLMYLHTNRPLNHLEHLEQHLVSWRLKYRTRIEIKSASPTLHTYYPLYSLTAWPVEIG